MIATADVLPLLRQACPGFESMWREHVAYWRGEEPGIFNDTGEFARYLVECYGRADIAEVMRALAVVERILNEGDEEARGVATVGVLESVQVQSSHCSFGSEAFEPLLGPLSTKAWREIERLWKEGGGSLAGVIRTSARIRS
jgi:hypothetical protein